MLGHPADARDYKIAADILIELGIRRVSLLTNNPLKVRCAQIPSFFVDITRFLGRASVKKFPTISNNLFGIYIGLIWKLRDVEIG